MLLRVHDVGRALAGLGPPRPGDFAFRNFCRRPGVVLLSESESSGSTLAALRGADFMLHSSTAESRQAALRDLFRGNVTDGAGWPDDAAWRAWERAGRAYLFVNTSPLEVWEDGLALGFTPPRDFIPGHPPANLYWFEGAPRFGSRIRHSCRLGRGLELWGRLREGIGYDTEGEYVRAVLSEQPSFVCEARGTPVCWATVHLNGTMGMIYTPPEHRRHGYARSLACFQVDHLLRQYRFACCHVVEDNQASAALLQDMGAARERERIIWRTLVWPVIALPPHWRETGPASSH